MWAVERESGLRVREREERRVFFSSVNLALVPACPPSPLSPPTVAAVQGHVEVLDSLVARGANLEAFDENGRTPESIAENKGHHAFLKAIKAYQAVSGFETETDRLKASGARELEAEKRMYDEL